MAIDPKTISAPTLHEGKWVYPESPAWSDADRQAWEAVQGRKLHETKLLEAAEEKATADATSPAALLLAARLDADEAQRAREAAERAVEGERAWKAALDAHGARVARIDTAEGDVIVMTAMTDKESDKADQRAESLAAAAVRALPERATPEQREAAAMAQRTGAYLDATLDKVAHPRRERVKELLARYPLLRGRLYGERDKLILGIRTDAGKGPAPS